MKIPLVMVILSCEIEKYSKNFKVEIDLKSLHIFMSKIIFNLILEIIIGMDKRRGGKLIFTYSRNSNYPAFIK